jgi:hypothetical protein
MGYALARPTPTGIGLAAETPRRGEGDVWYGKTKQGQYMSEDEAVRAGYRASKQTPAATR